jgi:hypothetical protein
VLGVEVDTDSFQALLPPYILCKHASVRPRFSRAPADVPLIGPQPMPQFLRTALFLILSFYSCTHTYKNDEEMIVQNDNIGGHINIITGKYSGFSVPPPLPSYCYMYFGTELWFV